MPDREWGLKPGVTYRVYWEDMRVCGAFTSELTALVDGSVEDDAQWWADHLLFANGVRLAVVDDHQDLITIEPVEADDV